MTFEKLQPLCTLRNLAGCRAHVPIAASGVAIAVLLTCFTRSAHAADDLETALRTTLANHPAIVGKRAEVQARTHELEAAQAQRYPTFSAQANTNNNSTPPALLKLRQPLWAFGRIDANVAVATAQEQAEKAELLRIERDLIEQTAAAYTKVLGARARVAQAQANVANMAALLAQIKRREQGQLASLADVALAQARWVQAKGQLARFEGDVALALEELLALTHIPVQVGTEVEIIWTELPELILLTAEALSASAVLRAKERKIDVARMQVEQERTASMPTLYLQADMNINHPSVGKSAVIGLGFESTFAGLGRVVSGRVQAANSRLNAATEDLLTARSALTRQVSSLWSRREQQRQLLQELLASVNTLEKLLGSYQRQYQVGSKSWLDVINMQREFYEQSLQQVQAHSDWLSDSLKLAVLSGRFDSVATGAN